MTCPAGADFGPSEEPGHHSYLHRKELASLGKLDVGTPVYAHVGLNLPSCDVLQMKSLHCSNHDYHRRSWTLIIRQRGRTSTSAQKTVRMWTRMLCALLESIDTCVPWHYYAGFAQRPPWSESSKQIFLPNDDQARPIAESAT
jgi:hypothetical protein